MKEDKKKKSLERAMGFKRTLKELSYKLRELEAADPEILRIRLIKEVQAEMDLYKGMYATEIGIYYDKFPRPVRRFKLLDDGWTYKYLGKDGE